MNVKAWMCVGVGRGGPPRTPPSPRSTVGENKNCGFFPPRWLLHGSGCCEARYVTETMSLVHGPVSMTHCKL